MGAMKNTGSHIAILATLTLLAACSKGSEQGGGQQQGDGYVRVLLPTQPAAPEGPPRQPENAAWGQRGDVVEFGVPGQAALLSISCTHASDGTARVRFVRRVQAEAGAQALFAVEGNGHVARVKLDVVRAGNPGEWAGEIDARAETVGAIKGGAEIKATLPGGGTLKMPASPQAGALLDACRASDRKNEAPAAAASAAA